MHRIGDLEVKHLEDFCRTLRMKIAAWVDSEDAAAVAERSHLLRLPDLFHLATHLTLDTRLSGSDRALLLAGVIYVASPSDLIPEAVVGTSGFRDDLVLLALVLRRVTRGAPPELLATWQGEGSLDGVLDEVLSHAEALAGPVVLRRLQAWVEP